MNCGCGIPLECPKCKEKLYRNRKYRGNIYNNRKSLSKFPM
ncbi:MULTISPECIES: hypothetical protein [unclassified Clostridium]|nr:MULTISPECIES: hypothetical protein [unclassified Clostridium]